MVANPIKTCVLGVGIGGLSYHIPFILALPTLFTLHGVLERNPQTPRGKVFDRFGVNTKVYKSIDEVLADGETELVIVATPDSTHYSLAKAALEAGKHVLVDKPETQTVEQAKDLGAMAMAKGLVLYGHQNKRWDSDHLALKRLLGLPPTSPQYIGDLLEFESHFDRYKPYITAPWKASVSAVSGLGSHLLDEALQLFGRPARITALLQNIRDVTEPEIDDTFVIHLHYNPRAPSHKPFTALLRSSSLSATHIQLRYVVRGTEGTFTKYGVDPQGERLVAMPMPSGIFEPGYGLEPETCHGSVEKLGLDGKTITKSSWPSDRGQYVELFKNLAATIRHGAEPRVKWTEVIQVIEIIELAYQSAAENRTVDVLPIPTHIERQLYLL